MAVRVILTRKWKNMFGREYPVGTILQVTPQLGSDLIRLKTANKYTGDYPPKTKQKIELSQLNNK